MKEKTTFKIGEISKLFDIGVDSIRYYEEVGILRPTRNPENNYRIYSSDDIQKIVLIRELLKLNFTTEQIKEFMTEKNLEKTISLLNHELDVVNRNILDLYDIKNSIENRLSTINRLAGISKTEQVTVKELDERACIMVSKSNCPDAEVDYSLIKYMHNHGLKVDTIGVCDCYTLDLPGSNPDSQYYKTKNVFYYAEHFRYNECNYFLPEGKYLSLIYRGDLTNTKRLMPKLYSYAKTQNCKITGDPIELCHIDNYETCCESEYVIELQLPVEK